MRFLSLFVALAALVIAATAQAAPAPVATNWDGFYVGGNVGGTFGDGTAKTGSTFSGSGYFAQTSVDSINANGKKSLSPVGFTGGIQGGYNHQIGNWVVGVEGDFGSDTASDSSSVTVVYPCCGPSTYTINQKVSSDWAMSIRPKAGYTFNNTFVGDVLGYITGGLVVSQMNYKEVFNDNFGQGAHEAVSTSDIAVGWSVGLGTEVALNSRWSVRPEYMYTDYGSISPSGRVTNNSGAFNSMSHSADLTSNIFRIGVNYKLN
jgi:outer membrane immunogenic protein